MFHLAQCHAALEIHTSFSHLSFSVPFLCKTEKSIRTIIHRTNVVSKKVHRTRGWLLDKPGRVETKRERRKLSRGLHGAGIGAGFKAIGTACKGTGRDPTRVFLEDHPGLALALEKGAGWNPQGGGADHGGPLSERSCQLRIGSVDPKPGTKFSALKKSSRQLRKSSGHKLG